MTPALAEESIARAIAAEHGNRPDALIEILRGVQAALGFVPDAAVPALADALNLSRAEVHGVVTFYHDFRREPAGRHVLKMCRAEACQAVGAEAVWARAREWTGLDESETSPDGAVTLDRVFCFGNCALGPSVEVNGTLHGRVTPERLDSLLEGAS